jgi:hypothetical protein
MHKTAPVVQHSLIELLADEPIQFDASLLQWGSTIELPPLDRGALRKLRAAGRAARHRAAKNTDEHRAAEALRKCEARADSKAESERVAAIDAIVIANPAPPMVMTDAPHGKGLLVTGGYGAQKIETVLAAAGARTSNESLGSEDDAERSEGKRVKPSGHSLGWHEHGNNLKESENQFTDAAFKRFRKPKEVAAMRRFVFENTYMKDLNPSKLKIEGETYNKVLCCLFCKAELCASTKDDEHIGIAFAHFADAHPEKFAAFMERLKGAGCENDHDTWIRRYGHGDKPLQCNKCKEVLWKPPKASKVRTDADTESES